MYVDMFAGIHVDMCVKMCVHMCVKMCVHMCVCMNRDSGVVEKASEHASEHDAQTCRYRCGSRNVHRHMVTDDCGVRCILPYFCGLNAAYCLSSVV